MTSEMLLASQPEAESRAQAQGDDDRAERNHDSRAALGAHQRRVEFVADDEHEQHKPDVGEPAEHVADLSGRSGQRRRTSRTALNP